MKIERVITWFDKESELMIGQKNVDYIDIDVLKKIFKPAPDDPFMYNPYSIDQEIVGELKAFLDFSPDLHRYHYQLDCFQI